MGWLAYDKDAHNLNIKTFTYMTPKRRKNVCNLLHHPGINIAKGYNQ